MASVLALATSLVVATAAYGMPADMAFLAAAEGAIVGFFPIGYIVLTALFIYDLAVVTGAIARQRDFLKTITGDKRLLALLIALFFGGFIEGAAGFSTPVALSTAVLAGVGFNPIEAAGLSLLSNTMPVAFGAVGTPVTALAGVVGIPVAVLTRAVGRMQLLPAFLLPFWIASAAAGSVRRGMEVWPACLLTAIVYTGSRTVLTEFVGPQPVAVVASLSAMGSLVGLLTLGWRPATFMAPSDPEMPAGGSARPPGSTSGDKRGEGNAFAGVGKSEDESAQRESGSVELVAAHAMRAGDTALGSVPRACDAAGSSSPHHNAEISSAVCASPTRPAEGVGAGDTDGMEDDESPKPSIASRVYKSLRRGSGLDNSSITAVMFPEASQSAAQNNTSEPWSGSSRAIARASSLHRSLTIRGRAVSSSPQPVSDDHADAQGSGASLPAEMCALKTAHASISAAAPEVEHAEGDEPTDRHSVGLLRAWSVWLVVAVLVVVWALAPVQQGLSFATVTAPLAGLDGRIGRVGSDGSIVAQRAIVSLPFLGATGTCLLISALISTPLLGASAAQVGSTFASTCRRSALSLVTIATLLALAFVIRRSGADGTLGLAFAETGPVFPFVAPIVGWLGVALTGSSTSSNVLFGTLQKVAAQEIGLDPIVTIAASAAGGPLGGMISLQSVVVAVVATQGVPGTGPDESVSTYQLLRYTALHSIVSVLAFGLWSVLLANVASAPVEACYAPDGSLRSDAPPSGYFLGSC